MGDDPPKDDELAAPETDEGDVDWLAYYLPAALAYLKSPASDKDGDFLDWITSALSIRCRSDGLLPPDVRQAVGDIALFLKDHLHKLSCCGDPAHASNDFAD